MRRLFLFAVLLTAAPICAQEGVIYPYNTLAESSGELVAWGNNAQGQLGLPSNLFYQSIDAAGNKSIAVRSSANVFLQGTILTAGPALSGDPLNGQNEPPSTAIRSYASISLGDFFAVGSRTLDLEAVVLSGDLTAWGDNTHGQLNVPSDSFRAAAAGGAHVIGLRDNGTLVGWGFNQQGQTNVPLGTYESIAAGGTYSLAIATDGSLKSWGSIGVGSQAGPFTGLAAGPSYGLAIRADGTLERIGFSPNSPPIGSYTAAAVGTFHALAIRADGSLVGWGSNSAGQLNWPGGVFTAIAAGDNHSLALRARTNYPGDLKVSYTGPATGANGLKANLNRNVNVAGNALIESPINFFNNSTLNVAGKVTFSGQANFNGVGNILSTGGGMEFNQPFPTFVPAGVDLFNYGPLLGGGSIELAGGALTTGFGPLGVTTGDISMTSGARLGFVGRGSAQPAALFVDPGAVVTLTAGQRLRVPGNLRLSGDLKLDGDRSEFDGAGAELSAGGPTPGGGAIFVMTSTGVLEVDDAALNFPRGAELQFGSQVRILGGTNDIVGPLQAAGYIKSFSGLNAFRGKVTNTGRIDLLNDTTAVFFDDVFQFGTLVVGNILSGDHPTLAQATFRGDYRGGGASGGGRIVFEDYVTLSSPVGPIATATFDTQVWLGSAATLDLYLGEGVALSRLNVNRHLHLGGALRVQALDLSREFTIGESFDLLDWGTVSGAFSSLVLPQLGPGQIWDTSQLYTTGVLSVAAGIPGDYNNSGAVDAADYTTYRDHLGTNVTLPNDTTAGSVTTADHVVWQANFWQSGPSAASAVPESKTVVILLLMAGLVARTRGEFSQTYRCEGS